MLLFDDDRLWCFMETPCVCYLGEVGIEWHPNLCALNSLLKGKTKNYHLLQPYWQMYWLVVIIWNCIIYIKAIVKDLVLYYYPKGYIIISLVSLYWSPMHCIAIICLNVKLYLYHMHYPPYTPLPPPSIHNLDHSCKCQWLRNLSMNTINQII